MTGFIVRYDVPKPTDLAGEYVGGGAGLSAAQRGVLTNAGLPLARRSAAGGETGYVRGLVAQLCGDLRGTLPGGRGGSANLRGRLRQALLLLVQQDAAHAVGARVLTRANGQALVGFNLNRYGAVVPALEGAGAVVALNGPDVTVNVAAGVVATTAMVPATVHNYGPVLRPTHYQLVAAAAVVALDGSGRAVYPAVLGVAGPAHLLDGSAQAAEELTVPLAVVANAPTTLAGGLAAGLLVVAVGVGWLEPDPLNAVGLRPYYFDKYRTLFIKLVS